MAHKMTHAEKAKFIVIMQSPDAIYPFLTTTHNEDLFEIQGVPAYEVFSPVNESILLHQVN